ncbi:hypothetical protein [Staphylococcus phage HMGUsa2]|nr:hypothetical protein [Staphylococcus phage HMGUsa2]
MERILNLYDSKSKLLKSSEKIQGLTATIVIDNLKPSTTYSQGYFKISWTINGKESDLADVPEFTTSNHESKQGIIFNTLNIDSNSFVVSDIEPSDTSKLWFKPVK